MDCPGRNNNCSIGYANLDIGRGPTLLSLSSSSISCLGSLLIIMAYIALKDMRTGAQKVITLLAVADFITAAGFIFGGVNYILIHVAKIKCNSFHMLCEIQSTITTWSSLCSFWWTSILAFYFFLVLVVQRPALASKLLPLNNVLAWISPMAIVIPLLVRGKLGYAPYATSNWCFIKDNNYNTTLNKNYDIVIFLFLGGKLWEIITYAWISVLYVVILCKVSERVRKMNTMATAGRVERRLLAIPAFFILCRIWGTLQFFYSLTIHIQGGCVTRSTLKMYIFFGYIQALGDGGQGWCNAILYILFSPAIRRRVIVIPCNHVFETIAEKAAKLLESMTVSRTHPLSERTSLMGDTASQAEYASAENNNTSPEDPHAEAPVINTNNASESSYHSFSSGRERFPEDDKQCA